MGADTMTTAPAAVRRRPLTHAMAPRGQPNRRRAPRRRAACAARTARVARSLPDLPDGPLVTGYADPQLRPTAGIRRSDPDRGPADRAALPATDGPCHRRAEVGRPTGTKWRLPARAYHHVPARQLLRLHHAGHPPTDSRGNTATTSAGCGAEFGNPKGPTRGSRHRATGLLRGPIFPAYGVNVTRLTALRGGRLAPRSFEAVHATATAGDRRLPSPGSRTRPVLSLRRARLAHLCVTTSN